MTLVGSRRLTARQPHPGSLKLGLTTAAAELANTADTGVRVSTYIAHVLPGRASATRRAGPLQTRPPSRRHKAGPAESSHTRYGDGEVPRQHDRDPQGSEPPVHHTRRAGFGRPRSAPTCSLTTQPRRRHRPRRTIGQAPSNCLELGSASDVDDAGVFVLPVAPDRLHKENVSGGAPYGFVLPDGCVDGLFVAETAMTFVSYLNHVFSHGGFPCTTGSASEWRIKRDLAKDLLPL